LTDLFTGSLSWRRLTVLVRKLPPESSLAGVISEGQWGLTDQLLAGIFDQLALANWQRAGNKKAKRPKPIPRPGVERDKRFGSKSMSIDEWRKRRTEREVA